jgi:hypothetical protein
MDMSEAVDQEAVEAAVRRRSLKIAQRRGRRSVRKKEFWKHGITKRDLFRLQHAIGNILRSPYNYDVSVNQPNYEENNQISQNAEFPNGWRGDESGDSEDYEWQWIDNDWQWRPKNSADLLIDKIPTRREFNAALEKTASSVAGVLTKFNDFVSNTANEIIESKQNIISEDGQWEWINNDWQLIQEKRDQAGFNPQKYSANVKNTQSQVGSQIRNQYSNFATSAWEDYIKPRLPEKLKNPPILRNTNCEYNKKSEPLTI